MSVLRVSNRSWQQAQAWVVEGSNKWRHLAYAYVSLLPGVSTVLRLLGRTQIAGEDWNSWWARQFDGYRVLPKTVDNYIELGCGPYGNTRLIAADRTLKRVVCSDPLARHYIRLRHTWLSKQYRKAAILIDDSPAEECPYASSYFDMVVMINVLDHVRDARACLAQAARILKPGGHLVLGQDLSNDQDEARTHFDVGHPIRLRLDDLGPYLLSYEPLFQRLLPREQGRNPDAHYATLVFIGVKAVTAP